MLSKRLKRLTPYTPGEQPQDRSYVKLNTNENPYPPSPRVQEVFDHFSAERLRLYPDPKCTKLREIAAAESGLDPENVFAGNGSDEVLSFAFFSFFDGDEAPLLFAEHTYSFYPVFCTFYGITHETLPLEADYSLRLERFLEREPSCGTVIANPNAPTGVALRRADIASFLEHYPSDRVVVVDEAYVDFGAESVVELCETYENLLVVQTVSKSRCLAGIRLGLAYGNRELIAAMNAAKNSFNSYPVDAVAQAVGTAAISDAPYYRSINRQVIETREGFSRALGSAGWRVLPSAANFVFASCPGIDGGSLYRFLKEQGILVRHFARPGIDAFVRISIGRPEEMERFLDVAGEIIESEVEG